MELDAFQQLIEEEYGPNTSEATIKSWHRYLVKYHGIDFSEKTAQDYVGKKVKKETRNVRNRVPESAEEEIAARVAEYLASYVDVTPNDRETIVQLATIEYQLKKLRESSLTAALIDIPELAKAQIALSNEYRQLQRVLGIDRRTRDEQQGGSDVVGKVEAIMDNAKTFYKERMVEAKCDCGIKLGHILAHFNDWEFKIKCPRCGKEIVKTHLDMKVPPVI